MTPLLFDLIWAARLLQIIGSVAHGRIRVFVRHDTKERFSFVVLVRDH